MSYTTADHIESIKSMASIPSAQSLFTTADFLRFLNHEMQTNLVPMIMSTREEYFVADKEYAIVSGQAAYSIPARAIGGKLRDVVLVDTSGNVTSLPRLEPSDLTSVNNNALGFYLKGNRVVVSPTPTSSVDSLKLSHYRRPNTLVETTACALIVAVDLANNQLEVASVPTGWTTGTLVDLVQSTPGFDWLSADLAIAGISGTTVTFASLPSDVAVGDYVALAGQSPVPQVPVELHPLLDQMVVVKCLMAQGKNVKVEQEKLNEMKSSALLMLTPRVDGEPKKITSNSGFTTAFRSRY